MALMWGLGNVRQPFHAVYRGWLSVLSMVQSAHGPASAVCRLQVTAGKTVLRR